MTSRSRPQGTPTGASTVLALAVVTLIGGIAAALPANVGMPSPSPALAGESPLAAPAPDAAPTPGPAQSAPQRQDQTSQQRTTTAGAAQERPTYPRPVEVPPPAVTDGIDVGEDAAPRPVRLRIPALGVDAPTIELGLRADRTLEVPVDADDTGWWTGGPAPGEMGPAVLVGHVDSRRGPGVFVDLKRAPRGTVVLVDREDGSTAHFVVERRGQFAKDDFPTEAVYGSTSSPRLRLITCGGEFDRGARSYTDNVVLDLALIGWS